MTDQEGPKGTVLVVDDRQTSRTQLRNILERAGYGVQLAGNGEEAIAAVRASPPDIVLLDLILPGMDGCKVAKRLRREPGLPYIPIILITTMGDDETKLRGMEAGADDFLTKPIEEATLLARVGTLLRLKGSQQELLAEKGKLDLLYQVSRELSAELDLDTLLARLLDLTIAATSATRGSIILVGEQGESLRKISVYQDRPMDISPEVWNKVLQEGLAGWVVRYHEGVVIHDAPQDPRWIEVEGAYSGTRSVLATPLAHAGQVRGVLTLTHEAPNHFTIDHLDLLSSIATQGAVVIEKARAYEREQERARQLKLVNEVARQVALILDPPQLLKSVARLICRTFDYYYVALALVKGDELVFQDWSSGRRLDTVATPVSIPLAQQGITTWVARQGRPLLVPNVHQEPLYMYVDSLPDTLAELAVPLQVGGEILGVLDVQSDRPGQLVEEQVPLLETMAAQVAVALRNAQMYAAQRSMANQKAALYEILQAVGEYADPQAIVQEAVRVISRHTEWHGVAILLPDEQGRQLVIRGTANDRSAKLGWSIPVDRGVSGRAFCTGQTQYVSDVSLDPDYIANESTVRSELAIPLRRGRRVLGVLDAESDRVAAFSPDDIQMAESLAESIALALDNARRTTELSIINEIGQAMVSVLGLDELLEVIRNQVSRLFDTTNFYIAIYDEEADEWETLLDIEEGQRQPLQRYQAKAGLTGYIIRHKVPLLFRSQAKIEEFDAREGIEIVGRMARSWLGVPLVAMGRIIGVMAIQNYERENLYDEDDLALFATIAAQAAVSIEKARLYNAADSERRKLAAVLADASDVIVLTDCAGQVLLLNPAAARAFGVKAEEVIGRPIAEAIPHPALQELFVRGGKELVPHTAEILLPDKRTLYAGISHVADVGYVAVMQDISELKRLDQMKSEFVSTVSHDLRNPLAAIRGYAELLEEALEGAHKGFAQRIRVTVEEMAALIGDLLDLGKIEAGIEMDHVPCDLTELIDQAVERARFLAQQKGLELTMTLPQPMSPVLGDAGRLRQVLDNLINNAIKYTPAGGRITVRAREEAGRVTVEVRDTGIGIPRQAMPQLFSKFYRVPGPQASGVPGTGLGLAIVKSIVERHGGQVWAESEVGEGSTFGFSLPAAGTGDSSP